MALYRAIPGPWWWTSLMCHAGLLPGDGQGPARREVHPGGPENSWQVYEDGTTFQVGQGASCEKGKDAVIVACGILVHEALQAAKSWRKRGSTPPSSTPSPSSPGHPASDLAARTGVWSRRKPQQNRRLVQRREGVPGRRGQGGLRSRGRHLRRSRPLRITSAPASI